jgi:hypothetical protein
MKSVALSVVSAILSLLIAGPQVVYGQNSADELYVAIQQLQIELGESQSADELRDRFLIRELETESAKGYSGDGRVFITALEVMEAAGDEVPVIADVRGKLKKLLQVQDQRSSVDPAAFIQSLGTELPAVNLDEISDARDELIVVLTEQVAFHERELSNYGAMYINKALELPALIARLEGYVFLQVDDFQGDSQEFNRNLNQFREEIQKARSLFARKSVEYPNLYIDASERALGNFERLLSSYLLSQTTRALAAFTEDFEKRVRVLKETGLSGDPSKRLYNADLGRLLGMLGDRNKEAGFDAAIRQQFSQPNFYLTISESWANRKGSRPINQVEHLDEVILGSRALGITWINGNVTFDFVENPHSALVRINLDTATSSSAYTKEGPVTAYTSATGVVGATRELEANIGNVSVYPVSGYGQVASCFHGTDCIPLVNRIAYGQFAQKQFDAEAISGERAQARVAAEFEEQTDEAIGDGLAQMEQARGRRFEFLANVNEFRRRFSRILAEDEDGKVNEDFEVIDPLLLPRAFVTTTNGHLQIGAVLEGDNRLAAPVGPPTQVMPVDVRIQLHESMVSNLIAPFVQDRLMQNWQFGRLADSLSSGKLSLPEPRNKQPWAIRFESGRPVQIVFENNELVMTVWGREFRREGGTTSPLNITTRMRIVNDNGKLKALRVGTPHVDYTYLPGEGRTLKPEDIAFRQFLQDNLQEAMGGDPMETAIELPDNLLFVNMLENEQLSDLVKDAVLVECSSENGWLNLGWVFGELQSGQIIYTPAIWNELPKAPPEPAEGN